MSFPCLVAALLVLLITGCTPTGPEALEQGEKLIRAGKYEAAVKKLRLAVEKLPQSPHAWNHLGLAYHKMGDFNEAQRAYMKALTIDKNHSPVYYNLANLQLQQTNYPGAIGALGSFVRLQPDSPQGWSTLGLAQKKSGQIPAAEQSYMQAQKLAPNQPETYNELGMIQLIKNQPVVAKKLFEQAIGKSTNYAPAVLNLAVVSHRYQTNYIEAISYYRRYLQLAPDSPSAGGIGKLVSQLTELVEKPVAPPVKTNALVVVKPVKQPPLAKSVEQPKTIELPMGGTNFVFLAEPETSIAFAAPSLLERGKLSEKMVLAANLEPVEIPAPEMPASVPFGAITNFDLSLIEAESAPIVKTLPVGVPTDTVASRRPAGVTPLDRIDGNPAPLPVFDEEQPEPKRSIWQKMNPVNWFGSGRDPAESPEASESGSVTEVTRAPVVSQPVAAVVQPSGNPKPVLMPDDTDDVPGPPSIAPAEIVKKVPDYPRYSYQEYPIPGPGNRGQARTFIIRGVREQKRKQYVDAISEYRTALQWDPASFDAYYNLGVSAFQAGMTSTSLEAFERSLVIEPSSVKARYNFALALRKAGYPVDAAAELKAIEQHEPDDVRVQLALGNLYTQALLKDDLARQHYAKVLELEPTHPQSTAIRYWMELHPAP